MNIRPMLTAALLTVLLAGCTSLPSAPVAPDQPWVGAIPPGPDHPWAAQTAAAAAIPQSEKRPRPTFEVPSVPLPAQAPSQIRTDPQQPLGLVELIDIAQRESPLTRRAWNAARQAALGVDLVDATFLPMLSASVLTGWQETRYPLPDNLLGIDQLQARSHGTVPLLALSWLLFDFGQRSALREGAAQLSFAANVLFNASHQQLIRDVTEQYYQYTTARQRVRLSAQSLALQQRVLDAAQARFNAGIGTTVDIALARQAVAQARLQVVNSQGLEKIARLALLGTMGLAPDAPLAVAPPNNHPLPPDVQGMTQEALRLALTRRPDIVAQYAALKAEEAKVQAAEAAFMPKVYLGAVYAHQKQHFQLNSLPELGMQSSSSGVMLGVSLPLFDGGLRRNRLQNAKISARQAQDNLQTLQQDALREMAAADTTLQSALASHVAASELTHTAQTAYEAALAAYQSGLGTITVANEAANQLLLARLARLDARSASQIAAANLAFATGAMVRSQQQWLASD
ncbi:TolC family protein [Castellaniella sp.]|uniref:TolC family protein n=1 Tax=Castellaniella sp. TaxID=1955812 RepID=UPI002AFF36AC|nr:TolC family protein [Castellaniella sp.]